MQADHHDHHRRGGRQIELGRIRAKHLGQRVVDNLDHLLAGSDRAQHLLADRGFGYAIDKAAHHRQRHIRFEQGDAHFAHGTAHVLFGQRAATTQAVEYAAQPV